MKEIIIILTALTINFNCNSQTKKIEGDIQNAKNKEPLPM